MLYFLKIIKQNAYIRVKALILNNDYLFIKYVVLEGSIKGQDCVKDTQKNTCLTPSKAVL